MDESRRSLLKLGMLTAAASVAVPVEMFAKSASKTPVAPAATSIPSSAYEALATLTAADFKPFIGASFKILSGGSTTKLVLAEVQNPPTLSGTTTTTGTTDPRSQTYALRFKTVSGPALTQGTYLFQNTSIGSFAMFVVPTKAKVSPVYYTGQVNRSVQ